MPHSPLLVYRLQDFKLVHVRPTFIFGRPTSQAGVSCLLVAEERAKTSKRCTAADAQPHEDVGVTQKRGRGTRGGFSFNVL